MAVAISVVIVGSAPRSPAQDGTVDVTFHQVPIRSAVEQLAASIGKSVAFDYKVPERNVDFDAKGVTRAKALWQLLETNDLYSVEFAGALIVAPDTLEARHNYSPRRIADCTLPGDGGVLSDVVFHVTPVQEILKALAESTGHSAVFEFGPETAQRRYSVELRNITRAGAIGVLCLAHHLSVRANGGELVFAAPMATGYSRSSSQR
jgi:hypothetical protein